MEKFDVVTNREAMKTNLDGEKFHNIEHSWSFMLLGQVVDAEQMNLSSNPVTVKNLIVNVSRSSEVNNVNFLTKNSVIRFNWNEVLEQAWKRIRK